MKFLEGIGHNLSNYRNSLIDAATVRSNIEGFIGSMSLPVGLSGPLVTPTGEANNCNKILNNQETALSTTTNTPMEV